MFDLLLQEFLSSNLMVRDTAVPALEVLIARIIEGKSIDNFFSERKSISAAFPDWEKENPFENYEDGSVAVLPIVGMMRKYGFYTWSGYYVPGMDDIANLVRMADQSPNIAGTVVYLNTPGGSTTSVLQFEDAMRNRTKPSVGLIDGQCCSGGIYSASFCNEILSLNKMCEVGSIGTYAALADDSALYEKWGIKVVYVYPPESKFKNLTVREALDGKPERMIKEELTPFAIHFQNLIKANRPNLDLSVEGIIEGRVFYASDAINSGLIDGIGNLDAAVNRVKQLSNEISSMYKLLN